MAHVLIVADNRHTRLAQFHLNEEVWEAEEEPVGKDDLSWKLLGLATMVLVSAAGWAVLLLAARHFLH